MSKQPPVTITTHLHVRRIGPKTLQVIIGGQRYFFPAWSARSLAGALMRGAARVDPNWGSKP